MAFGTGQHDAGTSFGHAQDKLNLTKGGILSVLYDSGCSDNAFIIIYKLNLGAYSMVSRDIYNRGVIKGMGDFY